MLILFQPLAGVTAKPWLAQHFRTGMLF